MISIDERPLPQAEVPVVQTEKSFSLELTDDDYKSLRLVWLFITILGWLR